VNLVEYYRRNVTYIARTDVRLARIVDLVADAAPAATLDVACGRGYLLDRLADRGLAGLHGVDVFEDVASARWSYTAADVTGGLPFEAALFDCVVAGEIIEHVPDPDRLLVEIRRVLRPGGTLVLSTPNMVSWANRILVPFGVQPLGTETSSEIALGRFHRVLGQGNAVQGHLKVFTWRALSEILARYGFEVRRRIGVPVFYPRPFNVLDRLFCRAVPLSSGLLYVATAPSGRWPDPAPGRRHDG
jgi:SAM-dependent methyltransferase